MTKLRVHGLLTLLLFAVACGVPPREASPRPDGVTLWIGWNELALDVDPVLADLVNLEVFGGFRPTMSIEEATLEFGPPSQTATDYRGTFHHYEFASHHVALAHLQSESSGVIWQDWSLYAYPTDRAVTRLFRGPLLELFSQRSFVGEFVLSVVSEAQDQRISAEVFDGQVRDLRWYIVDP